MDIPITEIGVGGAVALIILREAFNFVKAQKVNKNGNPYITRGEYEKHKEGIQYKDNCEQIVKRIDDSLKNQDKMFALMEKRILEHFDDVKKLIRNGQK